MLYSDTPHKEPISLYTGAENKVKPRKEPLKVAGGSSKSNRQPSRELPAGPGYWSAFARCKSYRFIRVVANVVNPGNQIFCAKHIQSDRQESPLTPLPFKVTAGPAYRDILGNIQRNNAKCIPPANNRSGPIILHGWIEHRATIRKVCYRRVTHSDDGDRHIKHRRNAKIIFGNFAEEVSSYPASLWVSISYFPESGQGLTMRSRVPLPLTLLRERSSLHPPWHLLAPKSLYHKKMWMSSFARRGTMRRAARPSALRGRGGRIAVDRAGAD